MYQIALCDDEQAELMKTERMLGAYEKAVPGLELQVRCFENAQELLYEVGETLYLPDLIFMDIYLPEGGSANRKEREAPGGLRAAKKLRDMEYEGKLVFLTASREHALTAFDVDALQYLVKPVPEERLFSVMDRAIRETEEERKRYILLKIDGKLARVMLSDIVYCEAQGKAQLMHLVNGTRLLLRMTMTEICGMLSRYQEFVKIGASFIVNLGYVGSLNARELHMEGGRKIYLPRGSYKSLKEQYFRFYCEEE